MKSISLKTRVKRFLSAHLAPEGTWRGRLKQIIVDYLRDPAIREIGAGPLPIHDRDALAALLPDGASCLLDGDPAQAEADELGAARFILGLVRDRDDLRKRFPRALSDRLTGAFCQWLCQDGIVEHRLTPHAGEHIRGAFGRKLSQRILQLYAQRPEFRRLFPLGLLPGGRRRFLHWLLRHGVPQHGLRPEEIWWFLYESAEDPGTALAHTYLQQPNWQRAVPDGLTAAGQPILRGWLRRRYKLSASWLDEAAIPVRQPAARGTLGVNILGHFTYPSGLQEQALAAARAAEAAGIATSLRDVPSGAGHDLHDRTPYLGLEEHGVTLFYFGSEPPVSICYDRAGLWPRSDAYRVISWSWELENVPQSFARRAREANEFWAHTHFIADAMRKVLPIPVVHMLPGVELKPFTRLPRSYFGLPDNRFLFLFVFDMNSVMERKNPLGLIRAFRTGFRPTVPASLVLKVSRGDSDPENLQRLTEAAREAGVHLIDRVMTREECTALMKCCDCYVSLHRSEGFGFTMAEAMLLGKPVIATGYSGNLDFMSPTNSRLVGYQLVSLTQSISVYPKGSCWAEPDVQEAARHMRWMYENPLEARDLGRIGQAHVRDLLSFRAAGERMRRRLCEIGAR